MRQVELAQRDLDLDAGIGVMAEHFGDAPDRLRVARRLGNQLDGGDVARARAPRGARRHDDILRDAPVRRHEKEHAVLRVQAADDAAVRPLQNLDDLPGRPAAMVLAEDARPGVIAVQHLPHLRCGKKNAQRGVVRNEKSVAVRMRFDSPFEERARDARCGLLGCVRRFPRDELAARFGAILL